MRGKERPAVWKAPCGPYVGNPASCLPRAGNHWGGWPLFEFFDERQQFPLRFPVFGLLRPSHLGLKRLYLRLALVVTAFGHHDVFPREIRQEKRVSGSHRSLERDSLIPALLFPADSPAAPGTAELSGAHWLAVPR